MRESLDLRSSIPCTVGFDGFYANLGIIREEDEHLIGRIVVVSHQHHQITSCRSSFTGQKTIYRGFPANVI
jgi:hypothetical protein